MPQRHDDWQGTGNQGFTLVEIAIVMVVIGLLVGGVLVARDLIRAAEMRTVLSQVDNYKAATNIFRLKYNGIPGDMIDATDFFGTDPGGCPNTPANTTPKTGTCNGNGNGQISSENWDNYESMCEQYRFWQQLADAGLIPGMYTGVSQFTSAGPPPVQWCDGAEAWKDREVPSGKISGSVFAVEYYDSYSYANAGSPLALPVGNTGHNYILFSGTVRAGAFAFWRSGGSNGIISAQEAYNIDSKIDDGKPEAGSVLSLQLMYGEGIAGSCVTNIWANAPTQWASTSTTIKCSLAFAGGF
jgi:prepilin-type N-terminal cleavage/methylation domain-containing protein